MQADRPEYRRPRPRAALLASASVSALAVGLAAPASRAASPPPLSQAWFAARVDASAAAAATAAAAPLGALNQVSAATRNLATLALRLQQMRTVQTAAAVAARAVAGASTLPNGIATGALAVVPGTVAGSTMWLGAELPVAAPAAAGRTAVTVTQTAPQAVLTWQSFNVGAATDLTFNQTAGGAAASNWVVLNRLSDPTAPISTILGSIKAVGKVFVINASGIIFGAGSQVNVGSLIASTATISDAQFALGIYGAPSGTSFVPSFTGATAAITVQLGAQIQTNAPTSVAAGGGYAMLLGSAVDNEGDIETPDGQTILAAGQDFILRAGYSTAANQTATVQGSQIEAAGKPGTATNGGLILASTGDVTLNGATVVQNGVIAATTSVNTRGTVHLLNDAADGDGSITLGATSATSVNPDNSPITALDGQRNSLLVQSAAANAMRGTAASAANPLLGDIGTLPDLLDEGRVELVTGGTAAFEGGSVTMSQGGQIAVQAGRRTWVGDGAALDVSGSTGAVLPIASNVLSIDIQGNELRDAPVNRDTGLITSTTVNVDARTLVSVAAGTGGDLNARLYTAGGLLEVSGYLSNIGHTIDEWAAPGGTVALSGGAVVTQPNAELNVAGGGVTVQGGSVPQSYLIGADGQVYNVNTAPADIAYVGVYGGFTVNYPRWGVTDIFVNPLAVPTAITETGYAYGRDAGSVVVNASTAVLEGRIDAGVTNGVQQNAARPAGTTDSYTFAQSTIALPGTLAIGGFDARGTLASPNVMIRDSIAPVAEMIGVDTPLPDGVSNTVNLSASMLSGEQLGGLSVFTSTRVDVESPVTLAPGGTIALTAADVTVGADLTARGGRIALGDIKTVNGAATVLTPKAGEGAVTITNNATLDLRGQFTNALLSPADIAGEGLVNGGALAVDAAQNLAVTPGTTIDASSGGAVLPGAKTRGGRAGSVTLIGADPFYAAPSSSVVIAPTIRDFGVNGGGTLTLTAPTVVVAPSLFLAPKNTVVLSPAQFMTGFSDYVINGFAGVTVLPNTVVSVVAPVLSFQPVGSNSPIDVPTGTPPEQALALIPLPVYGENRATGRLTQRQGASIEFIANNRPGVIDAGGGDITIGQGSTIAVDPLQAVRIEAFGQITDAGTITAPGGAVAIVNERNALLPTQNVLTQEAKLSIWVADTAAIDVAGIATTALDSFGRPYGTVIPGGSITIGGNGGVDVTGLSVQTDATVLIRQGATLNASGAAAAIDLRAGAGAPLNLGGGTATTDLVLDATAGGSISLGSFAGIVIDGTLIAAPGGVGAAGGTLSLTLETPTYDATAVVPEPLQQPRILTISQLASTLPFDPTLAPGDPVPHAAFAVAQISQQQVQAGGFGSLSLFARDAFSFAGDVTLTLPDSISFSKGILSDTSKAASVAIVAPYVQIGGQTSVATTGYTPTINGAFWHEYQDLSASSFSVQADVIDVADTVRFGATAALPVPLGTTEPPRIYNLPGFGLVSLDSTGDLRFGTGSLTTPGDLNLTAAQIYPTSGAVMSIYAGFNANRDGGTAPNVYGRDGVITVATGGAATPAVPYSVNGSLALYAGAIVQGGVVRAPEGSITLGGVGVTPLGVSRSSVTFATYTVDLLPGSITSVSLGTQTVPFGGTVDGVTYSVNGTALLGGFSPAITLEGQVQTVQSGATLDLSGGGTLAGAGFVTGRGGSTDVLTTPLLQFNAEAGTLSSASLAQSPVFAILPSFMGATAPTTLSGSATPVPGAAPAIGSRITIGDGVPGIAAGTYTLLPANYALLPGAARVQIDLGVRDVVPGVTALGAGSYQLNAITSTADTGIAAAVPVQVIVTTGAGVIAHAQYNQETYSQYELAQAANYSTPRVSLPEDGKTLKLIFSTQPADVTSLVFAGTALFGAAPPPVPGVAPIGRAGQASAGAGSGGTPIEIVADGAAPTPHFTSIEASALDALGAPSLVVGGNLAPILSNASELQFSGNTTEIVVRSGAVLTGPQIFLDAESFPLTPGAITIEAGATLNTLGKGAPPFDSNNGLFYTAAGTTLLAVSNGALVFLPNMQLPGAITVADGATLLTDGTLNFAASSLSLGSNAVYGARNLSLAVGTINLVGADALADPALVLPAGFTLTQPVLNTLLAGNTASGAPALQSLVLTANQSINFAGSVALNTVDAATGQSSLLNLTLNTPAIYGFGSAADVATIQTGTLYWNGIRTAVAIGTTQTFGSALPGGVVANGPGTGAGTLDVVAQDIVLGYGPNTTPDDQTTLDRLIAGFATVNLTASGSITGADRGTLSVYQVAGAPGEAGTGGALNLITPLLTGAAGSVDGITAGGVLTIAAPGGVPSGATEGALGAQIDLAAASIVDDGAILLNGGHLGFAATGDIAIGAGARIDLAGASVTLVDQVESAGGGALVANSAAGNITADAASIIDVSAGGAPAGSIAVTALGGTVELAGGIRGGSDAGQTSGSFALRTGTLADFDLLNARLNAGLVFGARSFEIGTGDVVVDTTVTAHAVNIAADAGSLTVTGAIEAGGLAPGSIALSAGDNLTLADGAVLNAAGTVPQVDSTGAAIEAENRATVSLTSGGANAVGALTLGAATIDVSAPVTAPLGVVNLVAPQLLSAAGTYDDVAFDLTGAPTIVGAQTIALYGSRTYLATDANGTIEQHHDASIKGSVSLDAINTDNAAFLTQVAADGKLAPRLAPLVAQYGAAFHLRPSDVIASGNPGGLLTVAGDLDLSTMRYGAGASHDAPGAGEVGMLTLRAANTLTVNGSISDGFKTPKAGLTTPDSNGWLLYRQDPLGQAVTLPQTLAEPITLLSGSTISTTTPVALNYGITIGRTSLKANVVIPTHVVTAAKYSIPAGGITATATITGPDGTVIATAGQVVTAGTVIPAGSKLDQGTVLPFVVAIASQTVWPKGTTLSVFTGTSVKLDLPSVKTAHGQVPGTLELHGGAYIPAGSRLTFPKNASSVMVRPSNGGEQGLIYAAAPMLPAGSQSWSINLVGGANLASSNLLAVQPQSALAAGSRGLTDPAGSVVLSDTHYTDPTSHHPTASFSVIRTGTGTLNVVAGGNVDEASLFGVYTAGTDTNLASNNKAYRTARAPGQDGTVLGKKNGAYEAAISVYRAYYPDHGGDVLVSAQGSVLGDVLGGVSTNDVTTVGSDNVGNWLWRQGGTGIGQATAWWINFGSYVIPLDTSGGALQGETQPALEGFTGIGALGGGNVTVVAGGDAGEVTTLPKPISPISQGLVIAVASTGRVTSVDSSGGVVTGGAVVLTGGGALSVDVGGTLNPALSSDSNGLGGTLTDMRGTIAVTAGQVGRIDLLYGDVNGTDPRPQDPFTTPFAVSSNGVIVVPGDGSVVIRSLRDLVLAGAGDPGRLPEQSLTAIDPAYRPTNGRTVFAGDTGFSLWTDATAIDLFSAGGNLTPTTGATMGLTPNPSNDLPTDYRFIYPGTLDAVAASGSFYYGKQGISGSGLPSYSLELAPTPNGQLAFIAANSIYANGYAVDISGADTSPNALPNPLNPAYTDYTNAFGEKGSVANFLATPGHNLSPDALFAFEADTPTTDLHAMDTAPALFYAATGDLLDFQFGEVLLYQVGSNTPDWYLAAKSARIIAGRDIISSGTRPSGNGGTTVGAGPSGTYSNVATAGAVGALSSGNLILNDRATDISVLSAGRDILSSYVTIAGPGLLEVDAGRNIDQTGNAKLDFGVLRSIGPVVDATAANRTSGAGIAVLTGVGLNNSAITSFADLYLNDANMADLSIPLSDPRNAGKVQQTYQTALTAWLQTYYGYTGAAAGALQAFMLLAPVDQAVFVRSVFFDELLAAGREHSDPASLFFGSYARGRAAIATLFPATDASGTPIVYAGNLTMDSGTLPGIDTLSGSPAVFDAGISTLLGGTVQILSPGGADVLGTAGGSVPGANSGVLTFGSGDIDVYALNSVLLGQSRIFTTFGGNILIWSADGDINAGRGAKTTTVQQQPLISYDLFGGLTVAPVAPTNGAGIATLAPIAGTTPGDVDLIAPLGTVDAGEAGIRVSGNLNIAALTVLNAANVQVQGKTTGNTAVVAVNSAAAAAASSVAGSSVNAATSAAAGTRRQQATISSSVITVEILNADAGNDQDDRRRRRPAA